jgi:hypothetical protein
LSTTSDHQQADIAIGLKSESGQNPLRGKRWWSTKTSADTHFFSPEIFHTRNCGPSHKAINKSIHRAEKDYDVLTRQVASNRADGSLLGRSDISTNESLAQHWLAGNIHGFDFNSVLGKKPLIQSYPKWESIGANGAVSHP